MVAHAIVVSRTHKSLCRTYSSILPSACFNTALCFVCIYSAPSSWTIFLTGHRLNSDSSMMYPVSTPCDVSKSPISSLSTMPMAVRTLTLGDFLLFLILSFSCFPITPTVAAESITTIMACSTLLSRISSWPTIHTSHMLSSSLCCVSTFSPVILPPCLSNSVSN